MTQAALAHDGRGIRAAPLSAAPPPAAPLILTLSQPRQ